MKLHTKQAEVAKSNKRFKVLRAGRRAGKTTYETEEIKAALALSETQNLYLANTEEQSQNLIWFPLKKELPHTCFSESRGIVTVPNRLNTTSSLLVGSWEKREKYRGMSFDNIFFDEVDTMKFFMRDWEDIFRPTLADRLGRAYFAGTPKVSNPNLGRLQRAYGNDPDWGFYTFTAFDNPQISPKEMENARKTLSKASFDQEWLAIYNDEHLAIFRPDAVASLFTNIVPTGTRYLTFDPSGAGRDFNVFAIWEGWNLIKVIKIQHLQLEEKIQMIRSLMSEYKIARSNVAIDAIGVGEDIANSQQLEGVIPFKSSYAPFKTSQEITAIDAKGTLRTDKLTSDFQDLRAQCVYWLAKKVNRGEAAVTEQNRDVRHEIEQELLVLTEAENKSKVAVIPKDEVKTIIGRSPDITDTMIMRAYFDIRGTIIRDTEDFDSRADTIIANMFNSQESIH